MKKLTIAVILLTAALLSSCANKESQVEENIKMYTHVWDEILNKGNLGMFDTHFAANYTNKTVTNTVSGPAEGKEYFGAFLTGFSDINFVVEEVFGTGDRVVKRWSFTGTHSGEFSGIPATGKTITVRGVSVTRIADGKIAEELDYMDDLGFLQQLGVIPEMN
jgi:uncharacterized protein